MDASCNSTAAFIRQTQRCSMVVSLDALDPARPAGVQSRKASRRRPLFALKKGPVLRNPLPTIPTTTSLIAQRQIALHAHRPSSSFP